MAGGFDDRRSRMVSRDIAPRGVHDPRVLDAIAVVPRERFVPDDLAEHAYDDGPLPIGEGQTISQPFIVALMAQAADLRPGDRVLEIGTGSGYGAAVLSRLAAAVWSVERRAPLAARARRTLRDLGYGNVEVVVGDGTLGWPDAAPYDAVVVTAGAPTVPDALVDQLAPGGRLVIPVGTASDRQELLRVRATASGTSREELGSVRFVPLVGTQGWHDF